MPKAENDNGEELQVATTPDLESLLAEVIARDNELEEKEAEILGDGFGVPDDEDDVIAENDDNPYQESDEALPDDGEERDIERRNRTE